MLSNVICVFECVFFVHFFIHLFSFIIKWWMYSIRYWKLKDFHCSSSLSFIIFYWKYIHNKLAECLLILYIWSDIALFRFTVLKMSIPWAYWEEYEWFGKWDVYLAHEWRWWMRFGQILIHLIENRSFVLWKTHIKFQTMQNRIVGLWISFHTISAWFEFDKLSMLSIAGVSILRPAIAYGRYNE